MLRGRGRRPRRPARPLASPMSSSWARRAEDVAPYQGCERGVGRVWTWRGACADVAGCGRGRRPRRPVCLLAFPMSFSCTRRAEDVAPYQVRIWRGACMDMTCCVCGCCVVRGRGRRPGGPRARWRFRWRPRGRGAPGTSRPTRVCAWRGACTDVAWGVYGCCMLRGRGRRPGGPRARWRFRWRPRGRGAPGTSRPTRVCAWRGACTDVAWGVYGCCMLRGRGRRPGGPRARWRFRWRLRVRGAPRTSRPTRGCAWRVWMLRVRTWRGLVGADVLDGPCARGRFRWRFRVRGAPRTSRPTRGANVAWGVYGRGVVRVRM